MSAPPRAPRRRQTVSSPRMYASNREPISSSAAGPSKLESGTGSRPGFAGLRPVTSDHIDTVVLDEHEHHHPHEDDHIAEEDGEEHESQSDRTLREEQSQESTQGAARDPEKGEKKPARRRAPTSAANGGAASKKPPPDPETREWKDDIVTFDSSDDPANPKNFPYRRKVLIVMMFGMTTMCSTFASSVFSPALPYISEEYGISREVSVLGISLFVLGYVFGPLLFAPCSELYGRKISILTPMFIFACFSAATATASNIQTIFITRFFGGLFGSAPVVAVGGSLADVFDARERASAVVFYSLAVVAGPTLGPVIGAAVSQSYLGWRWTCYLQVILTCSIVTFDVFFLPETFAPVLLTRKARKLRWKTGRYALHSRQEMQPTSIGTFIKKNLTLPMKMILVEPMVTCITLYNSFTYGVLYLLFASTPIVYEEQRGYNSLVGSLPFLAVLLGSITAAGLNLWFSTKVYAKRMDAGVDIQPELRLYPMCLGGILFPIGFFLQGWTSQPSINWFPSVLGMYFIGVAFLLIFQAGINYLIDVYTAKAASAVASNTILRSVFAAALPLVAQPMYHNLGVQWASTLLGCIAIALATIPFVFIKFGPKLRAKSRLVMN